MNWQPCDYWTALVQRDFGVPPGNPIYDAPIEERLADLKRAVEMAENMVAHKELLRPCIENSEGLKHGEMALGNWIVRPRFK